MNKPIETKYATIDRDRLRQLERDALELERIKAERFAKPSILKDCNVRYSSSTATPSGEAEAVVVVGYLYQSPNGPLVCSDSFNTARDELMTVSQYREHMAAKDAEIARQRIKTCIALKERNDARAQISAQQAGGKVVMPERKPDHQPHWYSGHFVNHDFDDERGHCEGWNACLDELARLNGQGDAE